MTTTALVFVPLKPGVTIEPDSEIRIDPDTLVWFGGVRIGHVTSARAAKDGAAICYSIEIHDDVTGLADASLDGLTIDGPRPPGVAKG